MTRANIRWFGRSCTNNAGDEPTTIQPTNEQKQPMNKLKLLLLTAAASIASFSGTSASAQTRTADGMQGMNWANPTDNGNGAAWPSGMTGTETTAQAQTIGQTIGNAVKNASGRTVRMPITSALATGANWTRYQAAINGVTSTGLKVLLCWWPPPNTGHRVADQTAWYAMWDAVNAVYGGTMSVRYEPINEPADYNATDLANLYAAFLSRYNPPSYKCVLDGTGYATSVVSIGNDSRLNNQMLGLHSYHWFWGSGRSWQGYYDVMSNAVGAHAWRTVVTELGVQTDGRNVAFWQQWEPDEEPDVALLNGGLAWARNNDVATIAWSGIDDPDSYHWFKASNNLTEVNPAVCDMFRWAWRVKNSVTAGTYRLQNRGNSKYLDNLGATADGANVGQWAGGTSNNQKWNVTALDSVWFKLQCVSSGKYLDGMGRTADGSAIGQWTGGSSWNQQWALEATDSGYYKLINRATGKCVDTGGQTANGATMQNWYSNTSYNQQWKFGP